MNSPQNTERFRALHHTGDPLLLPNAWDFASAAMLAEAGFPAVGTTSLGVAVARGLPDGAGVARTQTVETARLLSRLPFLLTVDIEGGFGERPDEVARLAAELAAEGVVGVNIEDGRQGNRLADAAAQAELIMAIKKVAPGLFVNARTDTYWLGITPEPEPTMERLRRYADAGADGVFVPGAISAAGIAAITEGIELPLNVLYRPEGPGLDELSALGVRRVSTGSLLFRASLAAVVDTARKLRSGDALERDVPGYAEVASLTIDQGR
ncbi:phosphonomutase [Prauserella marina]|uniref:2-Methylisocitrate lyase, PEP mutase family n=1 Tax=Prauserella marina TaxID=530584 RepID=A0A222VWB0_9PSEU|nr:isocitrate lyase/phosphoenolpyruvate mutase family protein [Prauserella marina]ASR38197.1 phosphonomutase [Prauserella marina]PWV78620.1 2-methylisocitrate lyase-like PEP mutase family enzyme [Prauserella marina]SDC90127.1 2-Methylisocitrate lyase, PEP mutase family [Prauserella marina]